MDDVSVGVNYELSYFVFEKIFGGIIFVWMDSLFCWCVFIYIYTRAHVHVKIVFDALLNTSLSV